MIYTLVPPQHLNSVWLKILPFVRRLVVEGEGRISEMAMYQEFAQAERMLWVAVEHNEAKGFISTKINEYAKLKMASLEYCAGEEADQWFLGLMEVIENWAKDYQLDGIEMVCGRKGWTRKFKQAGFTDKFTWAEKRFEKDIPDGQGQ